MKVVPFLLILDNGCRVDDVSTKSHAAEDIYSKLKGQLAFVGVDRETSGLTELSPKETIQSAVPFGYRPPELYHHSFTGGVKTEGLFTGMFLFGGYSSNNGYSDKLYVLDYNEYTWMEYSPGLLPSPSSRAHHIGAFYNGLLYILYAKNLNI